MTPISQPAIPSAQTLQTRPVDESPLRKAAMDLEAAFLAEMLKSAGLGKTRDGFSGGAGEDQFGSFLVRAQAQEIAKSGGIGLAETLFNALMEQKNDN
ncbi:rod-binding protein [Seohaeicola saemankumensis]|nr:rod-binding protein [Seohaeicola saemankumensis]MCA0870373.1 rod-binding protein [Seohaeicola saemankumensis]